MPAATCPADCALAAFLNGRPVVIDLDHLAVPADRRVPRRCERCHRYFRPGARGPVARTCSRRCADALRYREQGRPDIADSRWPGANERRLAARPTNAQVADALATFGVGTDEAIGYVVNAGREAREYAHRIRRLWRPLAKSDDRADRAEAEARLALAAFIDATAPR